MSDYSVLGAEDDNESMCSISEVQRNLFPEFDQEVQKDYLEVFLRIKPTTRDEQDDQKYLDVESEQAVVVHPLRDPVVPPPAPAGAGMGCGAARGRQQGAGLKLPAAVSAFQNNNQQQSMKFTFSKVFDESTNQKIFFDEAVQSTVREFLDGQNCLLFAYGVTNSGKTYTMQGTPSDAGVVPRTFDVIFNSIGDRLYGRSDLKPSRFCDVETLDDEAESREITLKESILRQIYLQTKKQLSINFSTSSTDISKSLSQLTADDTNISKNTLGTLNEEEEISTIVANRRREQMSVAVGGPNRVRFSIWASFAEVYNEQVYDLLVPPPEDATKSRRFRTANVSKPTSTYQGRPTAYQRSTRMKGSSPPHFGRRERVSLQLKEDVQGRPYISGLREVNVTSADEAFKLLTLGRRNLQMAYTKLNESSSRSHCIFTLKLMRVLESRDGSDGIKHTKFNILSLCDLAGIERSCKTQNMGERVKEAGSINNSLFTLSRCIQAIKHNQVSQASDRQLLPPFRESKLTRLFQSFLTGKGRAKMIVTVSQCRSMYPENLNAIKFSAIAKQVSLVPAQVFPIEMPKPVINPVLQKHKLKPRDTIEWATLSEVKKHKTVPLTAKELVEEVVAESDEDDDDDDSDGTINEEDGDEESDSSDDLDVEPSKLVKKLRDENDNLKKEKLSLEARIEKMTKDTEAHVKSLHTKYEELLERAELRCEEAMDKKVELLTDAYETALKRRRCDDDDNMATRESMAARIRDLEEDLQTTNQQLVNWKQNYDLSNREVQSLTREITEVKFQAAAERMQVAERSSSIEMENLELKAQLEKMKEKNETMENQYKNEVSNLTRDISRLEGLNKSLLSDLESQNLLLSSNDGELAKVRSQNLELLVRIKQLEVVLSSQEASDEYCRATCNKSLGLGDTTVNNMDLSHLLNNMSIAGAPNNLEGGTHFIQCHKDEPNTVNTESHEYATETGNSVTNSPESARNESEDEPYSDDSDKDLFSDSLNLVVCEKTPARNDSVEGSNEGRDTLDSTDLRDDATVDYQGDEDDNTRESTAESTEPTSAYTAEQDSLEVKSELDSQKDNVSISYEDDQIKSPSFEEERNQPSNPVTDVRYKSMPYIDQSCSGASEIEKDCLESSDFPEHPSAGHHPPTSFSKFSLSTCPLESSDFESPPVGAQTGREEEARAPSESTDRLDSDESKFVRPGEAAIASLYKSTRKTRTASTTKSVRTSSKTTVKKKFETPHVSSKGRSKPKISDSDENDDEDNNNDSDDDDDFEPTSSVKKAPPKTRKTRQASVRSKRTTVEKEVDEDLEADTKENAYGPKSSKKASQPAADSATTGRKRRNLMKMSDDGPLLSLPLEESHLKDDTSTSPLSSLKRHLRSRKL